MSKFLRIVVSALAGLAGAVVFIPGVAQASFGPDMDFTMASVVTVGQTGLPASINLTNGSDGAEEGFGAVICNDGDNPPCLDPGTVTPDDDIGINLILSCGAFGANTTCLTADPGVFRPSTTGTGRAGTECDGTVFDVVDYNPTFGSLRFTPRAGNVVLADPGVGCIIDFTVDVIGFPTVDRSLTAGIQTGQLGDVLAYSATPGQLPGEASDTRDITVNRAQPLIATNASATVALGGMITDRATVTGRAFPAATANVVFAIYGPNDATCAGAPVFASTVPISATQTTVTSGAYTPTVPGTYRWIATYAGDANNSPVAGACNDANESVVVSQSVTTIATTASATETIGGGPLTDTATVSGRASAVAGGTVTFNLYGPDNATCTGNAVFTSVRNISATENAITSESFTPTAPGTYRWIATYSGDANNLGAAGACNDADESTLVNRAQPVLTTDAGAAVDIGAQLTDTATVTGRVSPAASTIDFRLYGPDNADCSGTPVFESLAVALAAADTTATSAAFTPTAPGTYRWVATYAGDVNNATTVGVCGDPAETVVVRPGQPAIVTQTSPGVIAGAGQVFDTATVTGRINPVAGATIDFRLYGPGDTDCSGTPVFVNIGVPYPVAGGPVQSAAFSPITIGTHRWVATYSGDANNASVAGSCGEVTETFEASIDPNVELPATGSETSMLLRSGAGVSFAGVALLLLGRRRRPLLGS